MHVNFTTPIAKAMSQETGRYALAEVCVRPGPDGLVYCAATDGRILAVTREDGDVDGEQLIPRTVLPTLKAQAGQPVTLEDNGTWRLQWSTMKKGEQQLSGTPSDGRFPRYEDVLQEVDPYEHIKLCLDIKMLRNLSEAMGSDTLTLFVHQTDRDAPVFALTHHVEKENIGAIMPLTADDGPTKHLDTFNAIVRDINAVKPQADVPAHDEPEVDDSEDTEVNLSELSVEELLTLA